MVDYNRDFQDSNDDNQDLNMQEMQELEKENKDRQDFLEQQYKNEQKQKKTGKKKITDTSMSNQEDLRNEKLQQNPDAIERAANKEVPDASEQYTDASSFLDKAKTNLPNAMDNVETPENSYMDNLKDVDKLNHAKKHGKNKKLSHQQKRRQRNMLKKKALQKENPHNADQRNNNSDDPQVKRAKYETGIKNNEELLDKDKDDDKNQNLTKRRFLQFGRYQYESQGLKHQLQSQVANNKAYQKYMDEFLQKSDSKTSADEMRELRMLSDAKLGKDKSKSMDLGQRLSDAYIRNQSELQHLQQGLYEIDSGNDKLSMTPKDAPLNLEQTLQKTVENKPLESKNNETKANNDVDKNNNKVDAREDNPLNPSTKIPLNQDVLGQGHSHLQSATMGKSNRIDANLEHTASHDKKTVQSDAAYKHAGETASSIDDKIQQLQKDNEQLGKDNAKKAKLEQLRQENKNLKQGQDAKTAKKNAADYMKAFHDDADKQSHLINKQKAKAYLSKSGKYGKTALIITGKTVGALAKGAWKLGKLGYRAVSYVSDKSASHLDKSLSKSLDPKVARDSGLGR